MDGVIDCCMGAYEGECEGCQYSYNPDLYDGGCMLVNPPKKEFIPATDKQMEYAEAISDELGIDLPEEHSISEISMFIDDNKDDFYESRRERMGGYAELYDRIDRKKI